VTVTYRATDLWGQTGENTITIFVNLPAAPVVDQVSVLVDYNTSVDLEPVVTGTYIQSAEACLVDGETCVQELTIEGQGTFTVNEDGTVTFVPLETFVGQVTTVVYRAVDLWGQTGENTLDVLVLLPAAPEVLPVAEVTDYLTEITVTPEFTGSMVQEQTACLVSGAECVKVLTIDGQGTFTVNDDGSVTFMPAEGFAGLVTTVTYRICDLFEQCGESTIDIEVLKPEAPTVSAQNGSNTGSYTYGFEGDFTVVTPYVTDVSITPELTGTLLVASSVCLVPAYDSTSCTQDPIVTGQGVWTLDVATGTATFSPADGFVGLVDPIEFCVTDAFGQIGCGYLKVEVLAPPAPTVLPVTTTTDYNTPITVTLDVAGTHVVPTSACLVTADGCVKTLVIEGQGTYVVNDDGSVTFTPLDTFVGPVTTVTYRICDMWYVADDSTDEDELSRCGEATIDIEVLLPPAPTVDPEHGGNDGTDQYGFGADFTVVTPYWTAVSLTPLLDGTKLLLNTVCLVDPASITGACVQTPIVTLQGTWTINPATGAATFTPAEHFTGLVTPIAYCVYDLFGQQGCGYLKVEVLKPAAPTVDPENGDNDGTDHSGSGNNYTVYTPFFTPVTITPKLTGTDLVLESLCLIDPVGGLCKTTVVTPQGTWVLDPKTGGATFTPVYGFFGPVTPIQYCVTDLYDQQGCGTLNVIVLDPTPIVLDSPAKQVIDYHTTTTFYPVTTKGSGAVTGYCIIDPDTTDCVTTLDGSFTTFEGTWTIDGDGVVTFTAAVGFAGTVTPITIEVFDDLGFTDTAIVEVEVLEPAPLVVDPKTVYTPFETPITFLPVITGEAVDFSTACVVDPSNNVCKTTVVIAGVGTWTVDTTTGEVTFTPAVGFEGTAVVEYHISNLFDRMAKNDMTAIVAPAATLNGYVWLDINHNGIQDANEPGLPGVLVTAGLNQPAGVHGAGTSAASTGSYSTRTNKYGFYSFELSPGEYEIKALLTSSYMYETYAKDPVTQGIATDDTWISTVTAASNETNSVNFAAAGNGSLSGKVTLNTNNVVPKAQVQCVWSGFDGVIGTDDDVLITVTADANGNFKLTGIPGGAFRCGGIDPKTGTKATPTSVKVEGTKNPNQKPKATKVVLPIKTGGKYTFVVSNFIPGSPVITKAIKARIAYYVKKYKRATTVIVEGYTMGPTVLKVDYQLSLNRAKNAYKVVKALNTKIKLIRIKNIQDFKHVGDAARRVRITLYW
jgi:CshA-type fibril repeat protein